MNAAENKYRVIPASDYDGIVFRLFHIFRRDYPLVTGI